MYKMRNIYLGEAGNGGSRLVGSGIANEGIQGKVGLERLRTLTHTHTEDLSPGVWRSRRLRCIVKNAHASGVMI